MGDVDRLRISLANDFVVVEAGLRGLLAPYGERVEVVPWQGPCPEAERTDAPTPGLEVPTPGLDVLLFDNVGRADQGVPDVRSLAAAPWVRHVAVYASRSSPALAARLLAEGASGVLTKHLGAPELVGAIEAIAAGEQVVRLDPGAPATGPSLDWPGRATGLTPREGEVLALVAEGRRNQEIAEDLYVSLDTVKTHVKVIYRKLGVRNRAEAVGVASKDPSFTTITHVHRR